MSDAPNPNNAAAQAMAALLASDASPEEFTRRLLAINIEQARELDAELPALLHACAIPRQFDAEVLGALRAAPDEDDRNAALLEQIKGFSFVKEYSSGGFVYHDNVRDILLAEWQAAPGDEYAVLVQRLVALYLQRGKEALEAQDYNDALTAFSAALELAPDDGQAYVGRGKAHYWLQDNQSALADFARAIDDLPEAADNYRWRGRTYYWLSDYTVALADFTRAVELQPEDGNNYYWRGLTHYELKDYAAALADLTRAVELQPDQGYNYWWRGRTNYKLQDYAAALTDFTRITDLQPENGDYYYLRGATHYLLNNATAALADFDRAIELQPENGGCYLWRGATHYLLNNATAALADFDRAIELQPENGGNYYWRGVVLAALGQQAESAAALQRSANCVAAKLDDEETPRLYARLALLAGEPEAAYAHYREALQREPGVSMLSREPAHLASIARAFPANAHIPAAQAWLAAQLAAIE